MLMFTCFLSILFLSNVYSRSLDASMSSFITSVIPNHETLDSPNSFRNEIEYLIKHISKLHLNKNFIDRILQYQKDLPEKIKILKFLREYFQIIQQLIANELQKFSHQSPKFSLTLTYDQLIKAHYEILNLLELFDQRIKLFKSYIPPTMPFLHV